MAANLRQSSIRFEPVIAKGWRDLEELFGPRGACAGCWCMWWRLSRAEWNKNKGEGNRRALKRIVNSNRPVGILGFEGEKAIAWCAVAPRPDYPRLAGSRILKPPDDQPVWSVTCFFVARKFRRQGLTVELLRAAVAYAGKQGARIVEGYPVDPKRKPVADAFVYHGLASAFRKAGFREVARRSETRPIVRYVIGKHQKP